MYNVGDTVEYINHGGGFKSGTISEINSSMDSYEKIIVKDDVVMYPSKKLTVKDLAREIGSNEKYVSNLINKKNNMNFSNFINIYRVDYAKLLLFDEEYSNFTIEAIGGLAGFNSKSGFNATFKKVTGLTPTQFKTNKKT